MGEKNTATQKAKSANNREDRLKAALKANLARRKKQSRVRTEENETPDGSGQDKDE